MLTVNLTPFQIGIKVEGVDLSNVTSAATASNTLEHDTLASVVLIGMRGTGKSFIGNVAASALGWIFLDTDTYFEAKHNQGVREFVHQNGWPAFRDAETAILKELLGANLKQHVISLGGGIVESLAARELLKEYKATQGPVVHIARKIAEVTDYLNAETSRPAYEESIVDVYRRREPWFTECSSHVFVNNFTPNKKEPSFSAKSLHDEVARFFKHVTGQQPNLCTKVGTAERSYFLSLTYPDITQSFSHIEEIQEGVDALELRVDLLRSNKNYESLDDPIPDITYVSDQVAALRRVSGLPIVFTVRTKSQGGAFPDHAEQEIFTLLDLALRLGVEYVDVEISLPERKICDLTARKGHSQIIASWHDWSGRMQWAGLLVKEKYDLASKLGDIIKLVGKANSVQDNFALYTFVATNTGAPSSKPIIAINMSLAGQLSRVLNTTLTPVSHPLLPTKAAPGQLSFAQIQHALHLLGLLPARRFFLLGTPIAQSMSPTLHNTAFARLGLPHTYELLETLTVDDTIKMALAAPDFGGASVTIPFKLDVIPLLDKLTPAAEAIGAVNTIISQPTAPGSTSMILVGDNSDWLGIRACIVSALSSAPRSAVSTSPILALPPSSSPPSNMPSSPIHAALVIGAGGTARAALYALQSLNVGRIYIFNRTRAKAEELARAFPEFRIEVIGELGRWPVSSNVTGSADTLPPNIIISTVPASATTRDLDQHGTRAIYLPAALFEYRAGPAVVVDMAYRPAETPLLGLARAVNAEAINAEPSLDSTTTGNWMTVPGLEVLLEQGYVQFEAWTGRRCPQQVAQVVRKRYDTLA